METVSAYLSRLASSSPVPGGGSAAMLVAGAAAALVAMVARISSGNRAYAQHAALCEHLIAEADLLRVDCLSAAERDEAAFTAVMAATAMPKTTDAEKAGRREALDSALLGAAKEPLAGARRALDILHLATRALDVRNTHLVSDLGCAGAFASAALAACAYNVRINHRFMRDKTIVAAQNTELSTYEYEAESLHQTLRQNIAALLST